MNNLTGDMQSSIPARREVVLRNQDRLFRKLLKIVWEKSTFYREFYSDHGIREHHLDELAISDLPLIAKKILMENFDRAVIDPRLRKSEIERWLNDVRDPRKLYRNDFIVVHTSGSSGTVGIFVYSRTDWNIMNSIMAERLPQPENYPAGKTRVGFFRVAHGHFAGVSTAVHLPNAVYETLIVSVLDRPQRIIDELRRFQPHRMTGYSSSIAPLAQWAIEGRLRIEPRRIFVSGDLLTPAIEQKIRQAWDVPISNLYGASESLFLGVQEVGDEEMAIMDDLNIFEILDDENRPVAAGEEGHVVVTNLYNHTLPILRYELGDYVVKGDHISLSGFFGIKSIRAGKANEAFPIMLDNGERDILSARALTSFYARGLEQVQFVFRRPDCIRIDYIAQENADDEVRSEFRRILAMKGASRMPFAVRRVPTITADLKTGKVRLTVLEDAAANEPLPTQGAVAEAGASFPETQSDTSIVACFEHHARRHGERLAIKSGSRALTYDALNRAANRIAHTLLDRYGDVAEPIAVLLKPGVDAVTAILGILKAGKFYVPLDPGFPPARLDATARDAAFRTVITDDANFEFAATLVEDRTQLVNTAQLSSLSEDNPAVATTPQRYAYLLYTSGSTGEPKGVIQNHVNVLHQISSYAQGLTIGARDRLTFLHSHAFSASRLDIFGALLNGAGLFHFPVADGFGGLADWLRDEKITVMHWVPTAFRYFADEFKPPHGFPDLRFVVLGSEALSARDVELHRRHFDADCILVNRFGTTETGNICWHFIDKNTEVAHGAVPIGRAIDGVEALVLDETGQETGSGEVGEIAVRSSYLSPGYWRQSELTRTAFVSDGGRTLYRTGDVGYRLPDGSLVHSGRIDFQTKIRGHRLELGEIEAALLAHSTIREAAVSVDETSDRLVAYMTAHDGARPTGSGLRRYLKARLPAHMVPAAFTWLDRLPLNANGKPDRLALPNCTGTNADLDRELTGPRTPIEEALILIWSKVLETGEIGIHDSFFDLGGHSLSAGRIQARIATIFGVTLELRDFFDAPTIAAAAKMISHERAKGLDDETAEFLIERGLISEDETSRLRAVVNAAQPGRTSDA